MKNYFRGFLCAVFLGLVALVTIGCSNASGGDSTKESPSNQNEQNGITTGNGGENEIYPTEVHGKMFSAVATENGIIFTLNKIDNQYEEWSGNAYITNLTVCNGYRDDSRGYPENWQNRLQNSWTGLYALVEANKNYEFGFYLDRGIGGSDNICEKIKIRSIGGLGGLYYPDPAYKPKLLLDGNIISIDSTGIVLPLSIHNPEIVHQFFIGTGWNEDTQTWDGRFVSSLTSDLYKMEFAKGSKVWNDIGRGLRHYNRNAFSYQTVVNFDIPTDQFTYCTHSYIADPVTASFENFDIDDYVTAKAENDGIHFTVKKPEGFTNGISHIDFWESNGTGMELGESDDMQVSCVYPLVRAGKTYTFDVYVYEKLTGNCIHETISIDAVGGLGEPSYILSSSAAIKLSCENKVPSVILSGINPPTLQNGPISNSWIWYGFEATNDDSGTSYSNERWMTYDSPQIEGFENMPSELFEWFKASFEATGKKNFYVRTEIRFFLDEATSSASYCFFKKEIMCSNVVEYK